MPATIWIYSIPQGLIQVRMILPIELIIPSDQCQVAGQQGHMDNWDLDLSLFFPELDFHSSFQECTPESSLSEPFEELAFPHSGLHSSSSSIPSSYNAVSLERNDYIDEDGIGTSWNELGSDLGEVSSLSNLSLPLMESPGEQAMELWTMSDDNSSPSSILRGSCSSPLSASDQVEEDDVNEARPAPMLFKGSSIRDAANVNESKKRKRRTFTPEEKQKMNSVRRASACIRCQILKEDVSLYHSIGPKFQKLTHDSSLQV
jgi:hypothetical protein